MSAESVRAFLASAAPDLEIVEVSVIKSKEFVLLWIERREDPAAST
jgi:hypothetical protein